MLDLSWLMFDLLEDKQKLKCGGVISVHNILYLSVNYIYFCYRYDLFWVCFYLLQEFIIWDRGEAICRFICEKKENEEERCSN